MRSAELTITFPSGVSTVGSTFAQVTSGVGSEFEISTSSNYFGDGKTVKVSAAHPGTIGSSGYVYLGKWTLLAAGSELVGFVGAVTTHVALIQSASGPSCNDDSCLTVFAGHDAQAGTANLYAGTVSRRRALDGSLLHIGPITPPQRRDQSEGRKMEACDPCTSTVYGDANGDCILRTDDAVKIIEMIASRSTFQA